MLVSIFLCFVKNMVWANILFKRLTFSLKKGRNVRFF